MMENECVNITSNMDVENAFISLIKADLEIEKND